MLLANRVDFGLILLHNFLIFTPTPQPEVCPYADIPSLIKSSSLDESTCSSAEYVSEGSSEVKSPRSHEARDSDAERFSIITPAKLRRERGPAEPKSYEGVACLTLTGGPNNDLFQKSFDPLFGEFAQKKGILQAMVYGECNSDCESGCDGSNHRSRNVNNDEHRFYSECPTFKGIPNPAESADAVHFLMGPPTKGAGLQVLAKVASTPSVPSKPAQIDEDVAARSDQECPAIEDVDLEEQMAVLKKMQLKAFHEGYTMQKENGVFVLNKLPESPPSPSVSPHLVNEPTPPPSPENPPKPPSNKPYDYTKLFKRYGIQEYVESPNIDVLFRLGEFCTPIPRTFHCDDTMEDVKHKLDLSRPSGRRLDSFSLIFSFLSLLCFLENCQFSSPPPVDFGVLFLNIIIFH